MCFFDLPVWFILWDLFPSIYILKQFNSNVAYKTATAIISLSSGIYTICHMEQYRQDLGEIDELKTTEQFSM
jgi:hypothetical protein